MKRRHRFVGITFVLVLSVVGCGSEEGPAKPDGSESPEVKQGQGDSPKPETPADFLDLAEAAMAKEGAWTFAVNGEEQLTLQGQEKSASYEATVQRSQEPEALHQEGVVTTGEGATMAAEIYVIGGTAHIKEGEEGWKQESLSAPEAKNKIEDPVAALEQFRKYIEEPGDVVKLKRTDGAIELRVGVDSQKLSTVGERGFVKKAVREFEPTAEQLREAGVPVSEDQMTVSSLEETLVLDAETLRIRSHRFEFGLLIPYGGQGITFEQDVRAETQGVFDGRIQLPEGVV